MVSFVQEASWKYPVSPSLPQIGAGSWSADGAMEQTVMWVSQVWQRLNACLSRLGTHEALLGPQLFLSCPVVRSSSEAVVRCVHVSNMCTFVYLFTYKC